nr:kinetochore-associated protein DSN1 homolog [Lytechinus pictus]
MDVSMAMSRSERKRKADDDNNAGMSTIKKHQKRQKRRSSFMRSRSRKSLPPVNIESSEIHQKISTDLPEEKRLEQLQQSSFEYTMQKLIAEIPLFQSDDELHCKMRKAFEDTLADVAKSGILSHACKKNSLEPNPANLEMKEVLIKMQSHIRRLSDEGDKWESLLQDHAQLTRDAEKMAASASEPQTVSKVPETLTIQQRRLLADLPDLEGIAAWAKTSAEETALQIAKVHQTVKQMMKFKDSMEDYLQHELEVFAVDSFDGYQDITDPRKLLSKAGTNTQECQV